MLCSAVEYKEENIFGIDNYIIEQNVIMYIKDYVYVHVINTSYLNEHGLP